MQTSIEPKTTSSSLSTDLVGLLTLGDLRLGILLGGLREVVRKPDQLEPWPANMSSVIGALNIRSTIVPVVDLGFVLGMTQSVGTAEVIALVGNGDRMLGIAVSGVLGIVEVDQSQYQQVDLGLSNQLVSRVFDRAGEPSTWMIDIEELIATESIPTVESFSLSPVVEEAHRVVAAQTRHRMTVMESGGWQMSINVGDIHTTLPALPLEPSVLAKGPCLGVVRFRDAEIPVVDPAKLMNLHSAPGVVGAYVVIEIGDGHVALAVERLVEITDVTDTEVMKLLPCASSRPEICNSLFRGPSGESRLILEAQGLRADSEMQALSRLNSKAGSGAVGVEDSRVDKAVGPAMLAFTAGTDLVVPLEQVEEIIPMPTSLLETTAELLGVAVHRNDALPVFDLAAVLGIESTGELHCLLITQVEDHRVAFAIEALQVVAPLRWVDETVVISDLSRNPAQSLAHVKNVQIGSSDKLFSKLDLFSVYQSLR